MQLQTNAIATYLQVRRSQPESSSQRGRPRKRTEKHYAEIMRGHIELVDWFELNHARAPKSDAELYRSFRAHVAQSTQCERAIEAEAVDDLIGVRMKTVLNVLGEARRFYRDHPEKGPFTGMDDDGAQESNEESESEGE
ncbi:MAG: hypothetical protein EOP84_29110 [Verrucomicrobiaceae bacterium]|nr:MAG: hypothetical protein EOP84_29110 [Verrucomicrobiaceae bacterium]